MTGAIPAGARRFWVPNHGFEFSRGSRKGSTREDFLCSWHWWLKKLWSLVPSGFSQSSSQLLCASQKRKCFLGLALRLFFGFRVGGEGFGYAERVLFEASFLPQMWLIQVQDSTRVLEVPEGSGLWEVRNLGIPRHCWPCRPASKVLFHLVAAFQ